MKSLMSGSEKSKDSTSERKGSGTIATKETPKPSSAGSDGHSTLATKQENGVELIDGAFSVRKQKWGTYVSFDTDGTELITSLTEETCIAATRWYLKAKQDGFTEVATTYNGSVGGKL